jgi:tetratricopeptide (TPR) repeat protein
MLGDLKSRDVQAALDEMITRTLDQMEAQAHDGAAARALLARLCIMPGSFDRHAALYLRQHEMVDEDALDDVLTTLRTWRFLRDAGEERWRVEEIVRLAVRHDEDAFLPFVTHYTEAAAQFDTRPPEEWATTVERDAENITAVGDLLVERRAAESAEWQRRAVAFASKVKLYLAYRREVRRGAWLEMGLAAAQALGDEYRGHQRLFLGALGLQADALGDKGASLRYNEQSLALARALGDKRNEATLLNNIGKVRDALGDKEKALDFYEQVLALDRVVGNKGGEATTLNNIGGVWDALGEKHKALDYYEQALPMLRAVGDKGGEATTLNNIGTVWRQLGDNQKALDYYNQALPLRRAVGDKGGKATTLNNIGAVWNALGDWQKALDYSAQALDLAREVGDKGVEATILNDIGGVWFAKGQKVKALDYGTQALSLQRAVGDKSSEAVTCFNLGLLLEELNDLDQAVSYLERCVELDEQVQHPDLESDRAELARLRAARDGGRAP